MKISCRVVSPVSWVFSPVSWVFPPEKNIKIKNQNKKTANITHRAFLFTWIVHQDLIRIPQHMDKTTFRLCVHVYSFFFYVVPIAISGGGAVPFSGGQNFAAGPPPGGAGGTAAWILWAMGWAPGTGSTLMWIYVDIMSTLYTSYIT